MAVLKLSTKSKPVNEEREDFIEIDGHMYTIPVEVPPVLSVQYLSDLNEVPMEVAVSRAFHALVGVDTIKALAKVGGLTKEDLAHIMGVVQTKLAGSLEEATGN